MVGSEAATIELKDVEMTYENGTKAIQGISLRIQPGEFVFLVGPSGSGKSTIIKLLTGEVEPSMGRVRVNGFSTPEYLGTSDSPDAPDAGSDLPGFPADREKDSV